MPFVCTTAARNIDTAPPTPHRFTPFSSQPQPSKPSLRLVRTDCNPCSNSPCTLNSAKANSSASTGTTSISSTAPPPPAAPSSSPAQAGSPRRLPRARASERRITLPASCLHPPKLHREQQRAEPDGSGAEWQGNGRVFTTAQGRPIGPTNLIHTFNTLLRRAGLRRIRFHDIRHSTAVLLLEQGVELVVNKDSSATPTSASRPASTRTSASASSATPSTPSVPSLTALPTTSRPTTTATTRRCAEPPSTDVAVNCCRHPMQKPHQDAPDGASNCRSILPSDSQYPGGTTKLGKEP